MQHRKLVMAVKGRSDSQKAKHGGNRAGDNKRNSGDPRAVKQPERIPTVQKAEVASKREWNPRESNSNTAGQLFSLATPAVGSVGVHQAMRKRYG
jgi:hypothetical protein